MNGGCLERSRISRETGDHRNSAALDDAQLAWRLLESYIGDVDRLLTEFPTYSEG
jgi:hypothetical protein